MKARIVIDLENVPKSVLDQMRRSGFEVTKEGGALSVRVPNRALPQASVRVAFEELKKQPQPE